MTQELLDIVYGFRMNGIQVTDEEAESVRQYCYRKMEVAGIKNQEEYLPLLYADELKNYLIGAAINSVSMLRKMIMEVT